MAKFIKLPDELKSWKISAVLGEGKNGGVYEVSKKDYDGSTINAILRNISVKDDDYTGENIDFIEDEAGFLQTVSRCGNNFNYIDIFVNNRPTKEKIDLYIITEKLPTLAQLLNTKEFSEDEIVDFGIQMSSVLESLEAKNIFHGNLNPENIYVTDDGTYKVGGFSDFESKISDFSFVAPEIYKKEDADLTTDIYSLGLIMYYMSNGNKLPFENDSNDLKAAIDKRMSGAEVSTPLSGSDKLKSVIMIACKSDNKYRWKNAGNIKSALLSMKNETLPVQSAVNPLPESTEFDGNVFEEYEFDEIEAPEQNYKPTEESVADSSAVDENTINDDIENTEEATTDSDEKLSSDNDDFDVIEAENSVITSDNVTENHNSENIINTTVPAVEADETILDVDIFENLESKGKNRLESSFETKDYGSYFDEDDEAKPVNNKTADDSENFDINDKDDEKEFDDDYDSFVSYNSNDTDKKKSKKNIVIVIAVIAVLVILGCAGFIAFSGINGGGDTKSTQPSTQSTTEAASSAATAVSTTQPTTVAPTTKAPDAEVVPVVGYGYSYAKKLLEEAGFVVEIGEYRYSEEYPEGYVIAQSPEGSVTAKSGTVVTLDISSGLIEPETEPVQTESATEAPTDAPTQAPVEKTNNSFIFPTSATAYLSKSDVENLSSDELTIAINEIYARNGRIFTNTSLANYFNSQSWYTPLYTPEEFDKNVKFNQYEQANLQLLISYR